MKNLRRYGTSLLVAATLLIPGALAADDDPPQVVVMNGDEKVTISLDGTELEVVTEDGDDTSVHVVDLAVVGDLAGDALSGFDEVMAGLQDLQFGLDMGRDNNLQFSQGDETWEFDLDEVMAQVSEALGEGLEAMDTEGWTSVRERDRTTEELRTELHELRAEMRELRRQLREQHDDD